MEPDEYYDSLDEESNYESIDNGCFDSNTTIPSIDNDNAAKKGREPKLKSDCQAQTEGLFLPLDFADDDVIPFYEKNYSKSEVGSAKKPNDGDKTKTNRRRPGRKRSLIPVGKLKSKSYLDMFHAKAGVDKEQKGPNDTSRATASEMSPKSHITEESPRNGSESKTREFSETDSKRDYSVSLASFDSKFCSVSQQNVGVLRVSKSKRKYTKPLMTKVPELGGLGPDIPKEKLEILKRRQLYGQKVSENNKIKMQEKKLLQSLQEEIKRCHNTQ